MSFNLSNISINNFKNICRTCSQTNDLVSILQNTYLIGMLSTLTNIQIQLTDELPKMICLNCVKDLNKSYSFVSKCKTTDGALRQCLNKQKLLHLKDKEEIKPKMTEEIFIKTEITDVDEYNDPLSDEWTKDPLEYLENHQTNMEFENKHEAGTNANSNEQIKEEGPTRKKRKRSASYASTKTARNGREKQARSTNETCKMPATENARISRGRRQKGEAPVSPRSAKENDENTAKCPRIHEPLVLLEIGRRTRID